MLFNLNGLKVLEHKINVQRTWKGDLSTQNNLGVKSGKNADISPANHILPRQFQGTFLDYDMDL